MERLGKCGSRRMKRRGGGGGGGVKRLIECGWKNNVYLNYMEKEGGQSWGKKRSLNAQVGVRQKDKWKGKNGVGGGGSDGKIEGGRGESEQEEEWSSAEKVEG